MIEVMPVIMRRRAYVRIMHRLSMSRHMFSTAEFLVSNHMTMPIRMIMHVHLESVQPDRIHHYPDIIWAQVIILIAHDTDIFISVVDICIGNDHHGCDWWRSRSRNNDRWRCRWGDDDARPCGGWQRHSAGNSCCDE